MAKKPAKRVSVTPTPKPLLKKKRPEPLKPPEVIKSADDGRFKSPGFAAEHPDSPYKTTVKKRAHRKKP